MGTLERSCAAEDSRFDYGRLRGKWYRGREASYSNRIYIEALEQQDAGRRGNDTVVFVSDESKTARRSPTSTLSRRLWPRACNGRELRAATRTLWN